MNIPPTMLDDYRIYYTGAFNGKVGAGDLVERLTKAFEPNEAMAFGSAYHQVIEDGPEEYQRAAKAAGLPMNDYLVPVSYWPEPIHIKSWMMKPGLDYRNNHPYNTYEVPGHRWIYDVEGFDIRVRFKVDAIEGLILHEQKTTRSRYKPDYKKYKDSMQWRMYLLAYPDAQAVHYEVFHVKKGTKMQSAKHHHFEYLRYRGIENDVRNYLAGFIHFCETRDLLEHIAVKTRTKRV